MIPDPAASRAVLIGTSRYSADTLDDLPAVHNSLTALTDLLRSPQWWGLPAENCVAVADPATIGDVIGPIEKAASEATDTLLLYYAGHGLPDPRRGNLHFALTGSDPRRVYTAVPYDHIRDELLDSRAVRRVIILDCCYSGRVLGSLADPATAIVNEAGAEGTYIMAAASENRIALSPPGEPYTAFTAELLDVLGHGVPGLGEYLSLDAIYTHVHASLRDKGRPLPQKRDRNTAGQLTLVRNRAHTFAPTTPTRHRVPRSPSPPRAAGLAIGIDFGTTNSVVAVLEHGEPTVIANAEGSRTTPSVVAIATSGEVLIGEVAKRQATTNPDRTIRSVIREMGTDWAVTIDHKKFTPQQISAYVLQKLKEDTEAYIGEKVTDTVIAVPAYFDDGQREAVREACRSAGMDVLQIINEPTCAALAYRMDEETEAMMLVVDLGGGTFDVSLLEVGEGVVEVVAASGDNHLGGADWDEKIVDWLVTTFANSQGVDLSGDKIARQRLYEAAETAKIELSRSPETLINVPYIVLDPKKNPLHLDLKLTRAQLDGMAADLIDRIKDPVRNVLSDSGIGVGEIDHVILSGGAIRIPAVRHLVNQLTGKKPLTTVAPDEVVAIGACMQAATLAESRGYR